MIRNPAALVVDSDPNGLESLVYGFRSAGWQLVACPGAETAALLIEAARAQIVVAVSRDEHAGTLRLVERVGQLRQLDNDKSFRAPSVLVLGPQELRQHLGDSNADLLPLPAHVADVVAASRLLANNHATGEPGDGDSADESAGGVLSLLRAMHGLARSGALRFVRKGQQGDRQGEIMFREGGPAAAQLGQLQGLTAVQHLLAWDDAAVELRPHAQVNRGHIHISPQKLINDLERFERDYRHAMAEVGPPDTVYLPSQERSATSAAVPAEVAPVVRLCDGLRTLADVVEECPFPVLDTVRTVSRLVELALLTRKVIRPEQGSDRSELSEFWATAQIMPAGGKSQSRRNAPSTSLAGETWAASPEAVTASTPKPPLAARPTPATPVAGTTMRTEPNRDRPSAEATATRPAAVPPEPQPVRDIDSPAPRQPVFDSPLDSPAPRQPIFDSPLDSPAPRQPVFDSPLAPMTTGATSPALDVPVKPSAPTSSQTSGIFKLRKSEPAGRPLSRAIERRSSVVLDATLTDCAVPPGEMAGASSSDQAEAPPASPAAKVGHDEPPAGQMTATLAASATQPAATDVHPKSEGGNAPAQLVPEDSVKDAKAGRDGATARAAGELAVKISGKSSRSAAKRESAASFAIDPSLLAASAPDQLPRAEPAAPPAREAPGARRPSGSFSALESEFFEREADLYKVEHSESFADLEDSKPKPGGANKLVRGPAKR
ncbi:MAG: hypothetical protein ABSB49_18110 [Polyangia bacterium]